MTWYKHSVERWALPKPIERRLMYSGGTDNRIYSIKALELALTSTRQRHFYLDSVGRSYPQSSFLRKQTAQGCLL